MNLRLLASPEWAATLRDEVLAMALGGIDLGGDLLGDDVLELGLGPG
jgi:hypothetical protein